jgi:hypothetical protein
MAARDAWNTRYLVNVRIFSGDGASYLLSATSTTMHPRIIRG